MNQDSSYLDHNEINLKGLNSYGLCSLTIMEFKDKSVTEKYMKIPKCLEIKQHISIMSIGEIINHKRNYSIFELNRNKNTTYQNLWDTATCILRRKCSRIYYYIQQVKLS